MERMDKQILFIVSAGDQPPALAIAIDIAKRMQAIDLQVHVPVHTKYYKHCSQCCIHIRRCCIAHKDWHAW